MDSQLQQCTTSTIEAIVASNYGEHSKISISGSESNPHLLHLNMLFHPLRQKHMNQLFQMMPPLKKKRRPFGRAVNKAFKPEEEDSFKYTEVVDD